MKPSSVWYLLLQSFLPSVVCISFCTGISALALGIVGNLYRVSLPNYVMAATGLSVAAGWLAGTLLTVAAHVASAIREDAERSPLEISTSSLRLVFFVLGLLSLISVISAII